MNLQTHSSGQVAGQVLNQARSPSSGLTQQNHNPMPGQIQYTGMHDPHQVLDYERKLMQRHILELVMQKRPPQEGSNKQRIMDMVRRIDTILLKSATTKEEYLNLATLGTRLQLLVRRHQNQQFLHSNSSPPIGTMIPTPGLQQPGNSPLDSTIATNHNSNMIAPSSFNSGSFLPNGNRNSGSLVGSPHGALATGYQQSSAFSVNYGGNYMATPMGVPEMTSQMIPTPGFNHSNDIDNNSKKPSHVTAFPVVESTYSQQYMQKKQLVGSQNGRILQNPGVPVGGGTRSTLHKSYGSPNAPLHGGQGMTTSNVSQIDVPRNPPRPMDQHFEHQLSIMQGDRCGISGVDASGSQDLYVPAASAVSLINNQSSSAASMQSMTKTHGLLNGQSTMDCTQRLVKDEPQSIDESEHYSARENYVQDNRPQSFQQPSPEFQREIQPQAPYCRFSQSQLSSNIVSEPKSELGTDNCVEGLQSQVSNPFRFSEMPSQFQKKSMKGHSKSTRFLTHSSGPTGFISPLTQISNSSHSHQFAGSPQADDALHGQRHSRSQDVSHASDSEQQLHDQVLQGESYNSLAAQGDQLKNVSSEESVPGQSDDSRPAECPSTSDSVFRYNNPSSDSSDSLSSRQAKWMIFLMHARQCESKEGNCGDRKCPGAQKLLKHIEHCINTQCPYPSCFSSKALIAHYRKCQNANCQLCNKVKLHVQTRRKGGLGRSKSCGDVEISGGTTHTMSPVSAETPGDQPPVKRIKIEHCSQSIFPENERSGAVPSVVVVSPVQDGQHVQLRPECHMPVKSEVSVKTEVPSSCQLPLKTVKMENSNLDGAYMQKTEGESVASNNLSGSSVQAIIKIEKAIVQAKPENLTASSESAPKPGKPKIKGVSMTELFTPEQIRQHITGLRQWVGQSKAKAERNQAMEHSMNANSCQLCAVEKLAFEPPPLYCTPCGVRIRRNAMYYTVGTGETRHYFCLACYNEARGDTMVVIGKPIPKARMEKKRNDEETEEWWVQCDKCELWQHQICALFNGRRNEGGQAEYTCPNCYIGEVERGERDPLPQSTVLGAKDLPKTILSDHLEQRLFAKLKQERQDRARVQGKCYDEVPGAESLVVRVVSSVDKKLEVKPRFLEIFQDDDYPIDFPYKSKVVLLFQNIEGVEVCLFGMYVQEFGSDCRDPNHRRVYLSYLDSVKYFRPDVKTVTGEALRTFVYHEILIGYLEYCKQRGFTSCYIWACPPLKGEDYILYCHPEIQKTPKSDKLREWYLSMLRKAAKENIVVELTNLYEHFFVSTGERKAKVTASRLPYFDGDYWPGAVEDMLLQLQQEEDGRKQNKKGPMKKTITKRSMQASGQIDLSTNAAKDQMLMRKLGETISPMKEDFIMVHLQHSCDHCCTLMVSGSRWVCRQCKNFQLCDRCYDAEQKYEDRDRHPINQKEKHSFYPVPIEGIPDDTKDEDEILESEFFDTRQAFLSLCQGNHYQYDTLRRAKHSSMMALYHLHNPTAPAFVATCNVCSLDIESGQGWRCETCTDYDVCNSCYQKDAGINHPHKLIYNPSNGSDAQNTEARDKRVMQLKEMLKLLVHASQCRSPQCQFDNCRKVKGLFRHGMICKTRINGGCLLCKKMWYLLQLHSRSCKQAGCSVPRCRDLREHIKRMQQQADSRRRAAVNEMMRNRALEVSGNL